jgi:hypothetical protein
VYTEPIADGIGKILEEARLPVAAGGVQAFEHLIANIKTLKDPCQCAIRLLNAILRDMKAAGQERGINFAETLIECFDISQIGTSTFRDLREKGEKLTAPYARDVKTQRRLHQIIVEIIKKCNPPARPVVKSPTPKPTPPPPPKPAAPPRVQPVEAPPRAQEFAAVCPECLPLLRELKQEIARRPGLEKNLGEVRSQLNKNRAEQQDRQKNINELQARAGAQEGTGGSSTDPETGITIEAFTQADGSVKITTRDARGNIIDERTREPRDTSRLKQEIKEQGAEIDKLKEAEGNLDKDLARARRDILDNDDRVDALLILLRDCIEEKCRKFLAIYDDILEHFGIEPPLKFASACPPCAEAAREFNEVNSALQMARLRLSLDRGRGSEATAGFAEFKTRPPDDINAGARRPEWSGAALDILVLSTLLYSEADALCRLMPTSGSSPEGAHRLALAAVGFGSKEEAATNKEQIADLENRAAELRKQLEDCAKGCDSYLGMKVEFDQVFSISGVNPYKLPNPLGDQPAVPAPAAPGTPPPPPAVSNLFVSGPYSCGGCGLAGSSTLTASGSAVTLVPGPNGVTSFAVAPPGDTATGGSCTLTFINPPGPLCFISISCSVPACAASCSPLFSPCLP